ncbi:PREDICTED: uncharacterized protein LOC108618172 [Drosophila arizonae]|uniref:Uncharacterized protein LOC108618172 n=1 Tax=Drosophila arizonae TaxID=7263 RepID=A0ABM1PQS9_DROAR|nr:PREDICTED: uncharacterized protein LOC108618172 [Drosophila arizonae]
MAAIWIYIGCALLLLCLCASARAAPSVSDLEQLGELERTLKELATSVLAMNGGIAGSGESDIGRPTYWANHIHSGLYFSSGRGFYASDSYTFGTPQSIQTPTQNQRQCLPAFEDEDDLWFRS